VCHSLLEGTNHSHSSLSSTQAVRILPAARAYSLRRLSLSKRNFRYFRANFKKRLFHNSCKYRCDGSVICMLSARVLYNRGHAPSQMLCTDPRHKRLAPKAAT
jgi:hypothetical protein